MLIAFLRTRSFKLSSELSACELSSIQNHWIIHRIEYEVRITLFSVSARSLPLQLRRAQCVRNCTINSEIIIDEQIVWVVTAWQLYFDWADAFVLKGIQYARHVLRRGLMMMDMVRYHSLLPSIVSFSIALSPCHRHRLVSLTPYRMLSKLISVRAHSHTRTSTWHVVVDFFFSILFQPTHSIVVVVSTNSIGISRIWSNIDIKCHYSAFFRIPIDSDSGQNKKIRWFFQTIFCCLLRHLNCLMMNSLETIEHISKSLYSRLTNAFLSKTDKNSMIQFAVTLWFEPCDAVVCCVPSECGKENGEYLSHYDGSDVIIGNYLKI